MIGSQAVLVALGIDWDGRRQVLAVELANRESASSWKAFLLQLKERGLSGVRFVVRDDHAGLGAAVSEVVPEAVQQRCYVHFLRNALDHMPRKRDDDCLQELRWLYDRGSLEEARRDLAAWLLPHGSVTALSRRRSRCETGTTTVSTSREEMVEFAEVGRRRVDWPAGAQHHPVVLGAAEQLAPRPRPEQDEIRRTVLTQPSRVGKARSVGRGSRNRGWPVTDGMVEMGDLHRLGEHFQPIEIAIGVERVAHVVAGKRYRDAPRLHLVQQRNAAPARGFPGTAILEIQVAQRQADRVQPCCGSQVKRTVNLVRRTPGEAAAMTDNHPSLELVRDDGARDAIERTRLGIARLVDMEVEIETALIRQPENPLQQRIPSSIDSGHCPQNATAIAHKIGDFRPKGRVSKRIQRHQRHRLESNPSVPLLAHLLQDRP